MTLSELITLYDNEPDNKKQEEIKEDIRVNADREVEELVLSCEC